MHSVPPSFGRGPMHPGFFLVPCPFYSFHSYRLKSPQTKPCARILPKSLEGGKKFPLPPPLFWVGCPHLLRGILEARLPSLCWLKALVGLPFWVVLVFGQHTRGSHYSSLVARAALYVNVGRASSVWTSVHDSDPRTENRASFVFNCVFIFYNVFWFPNDFY